MPRISPVLLCWWLVAAGAPVPAQSAEPAPASPRLLARPAVQWLALSAAQLAQLQALGREHERRLAEWGAQLTRPGRPADAALAAQVCERARATEASYLGAARAVLDDAQRERLAALEEALALTQVAVSAQGLGLLAPAGAAAPAGLPQSAVKGRATWRLVPLPALPGCPATQVVPELDMERPSRP